MAAKNNEEGGTRFYDRSTGSAHAERMFDVEGLEEVRVGANFRRYTPDTAASSVTRPGGHHQQEVGLYAGPASGLQKTR